MQLSVRIPNNRIIPFYQNGIINLKYDDIENMFMVGGIYDLIICDFVEPFQILKVTNKSLIVKSLVDNPHRNKFTLTRQDCLVVGVDYDPKAEIFPMLSSNNTVMWKRHRDTVSIQQYDPFDLTTYPSGNDYDHYLQSILIKISGFKYRGNVGVFESVNNEHYMIDGCEPHNVFFITNTVQLGDTTDLTCPCIEAGTNFRNTIVTSHYAHVSKKTNLVDLDGNIFVRIMFDQALNPSVFKHKSFDEIFNLKCEKFFTLKHGNFCASQNPPQVYWRY